MIFFVLLRDQRFPILSDLVWRSQFSQNEKARLAHFWDWVNRSGKPFAGQIPKFPKFPNEKQYRGRKNKFREVGFGGAVFSSRPGLLVRFRAKPETTIAVMIFSTAVRLLGRFTRAVLGAGGKSGGKWVLAFLRNSSLVRASGRLFDSGSGTTGSPTRQGMKYQKHKQSAAMCTPIFIWRQAS